jgi:hypothetical protein
MTRTFTDSGVLIAAARGTDAVSGKARAVLTDANRQFISSDLVRLEVLPKPTYFKRAAEVAFYQAFFAIVQDWVALTPALIQRALQRGSDFGLGAVDTLHVAAAELAQADELVTSERLTSPICRVTSVRVVSLQ